MNPSMCLSRSRSQFLLSVKMPKCSAARTVRPAFRLMKILSIARHDPSQTPIDRTSPSDGCGWSTRDGWDDRDGDWTDKRVTLALFRLVSCDESCTRPLLSLPQPCFILSTLHHDICLTYVLSCMRFIDCVHACCMVEVLWPTAMPLLYRSGLFLPPYKHHFVSNMDLFSVLYRIHLSSTKAWILSCALPTATGMLPTERLRFRRPCQSTELGHCVGPESCDTITHS
jgi:hypothetical protein